MSRRTAVRSGSTVDAEVANLFKLQNKSQFTNALLSLRQRYRDEDLVDKIQDVFMQKHSAIVKSAKKFAMAVREKYSQQNVPFHQLLMKARAHAKKHHLSEAEFAEFQRIYEQELAGSGSGEVVIPMTSIMKVLGNVTTGTEGSFNVGEADFRNLQEILKLHDMSKPLHAQVLLQAIQYNQVVEPARFNKQMQNPGDHVHPVVAALFYPKIKTVDEHFLYSNMSGIIKCRYNHQPLTTRPDYELFYNLVTDPNDVVCDTRTPMADLLHRCNLQNQLWNSVLHLRNGQIYNPSLREFMSSVDVCRLNKYDNPDLVYGRHDGTIIKRLFSAFSFRPTVVATLPVANLFGFNPYSQNMRPTITSIPMINIRLSNFGQRFVGAQVAPRVQVAPVGQAVPAGQAGVDAVAALAAEQAAAAGNLVAALTQTNQFLEGNSIVNRHTSVMFSRELLVYYIDRRAYVVQMGSNITNMARLPTSIAGFERINNLPLGYQPQVQIPNEDVPYNFVSAVIADLSPPPAAGAVGEFVIGSSTIFLSDNGYYHYSPANVLDGNNVRDSLRNLNNADNNALATGLINTQAVILIYVKPNYQDGNANFIN